jgi:hypothetical protein
MNTKKRIDGDYYIQTINPDDRVYIDTDTVEVDGNLVVNGNLTYINTEQLNVKDPFIMVNSSNTATYSANSGVLTHKTASTYAGIRYSADDNQWQISINTGTNGDTGSWDAIATAAGATPPGGPNTAVQYNNNGSFAGESQFTWDEATDTLAVTGTVNAVGNVSIDGPIHLADQSSVPASVATTTVLYANVAGSGGTGVYFVDGAITDELVSKSKAIVYGIIF